MTRPLRTLLLLALLGSALAPGTLTAAPAAAATTLDARPSDSVAADAVASVGIIPDDELSVSSGDLATVIGLAALLVIGGGIAVGVEIRRRRGPRD